MKKIWVVQYNDGTADVWDEEQGPPSWPYIDAFDVENALKELHSDYAALLARHNALVEVVRGLLGSLDNGEFKTTITHSVAAEIAEKVYRINRAEVDRLLQEDK